MGEVQLAALLCSFLGGGTTEVRHEFENLAEPRSIRVDCETADFAIEIGLDKRSARDSLHQALFAAALTGKRAYVLLIDTDGVEGRYEQEARIVAESVGVAYGRCAGSFIQRWAATAAFRPLGLDKDLDDLPREIAFAQFCDLGPDFFGRAVSR